MDLNLGCTKLLVILLFIASTSQLLLSQFAFADTGILDSEEVKTLKEIARKLGKNDWDFENEDPCSGKGQWHASDKSTHFESIVVCKCNDSSCHVESMYCSLTILTILFLAFLLSSFPSVRINNLSSVVFSTRERVRNNCEVIKHETLTRILELWKKNFSYAFLLTDTSKL